MIFFPHEKIFAGKQLPNKLKIAFHPVSHTLQIRGNELEIEREIKLERKSFSDVFRKLKNALKELKLDVSDLTTKQPYKLPSDSLKEGRFFRENKTELIEENIRYRHNANLVLHLIISKFGNSDPVRIWPHHFDTGSIIHHKKNENEKTIKSFGLGWAIPGKMVPEPYFYLSFWSKNPTNSLKNPQSLPAGKWMMPEWDGAVLPLSDILSKTTPDEQYNMVKEFFRSGLISLRKIF